LREGVRYLELNRVFDIKRTGATEYYTAQINALNLSNILSKIRNLARRKFLQQFPVKSPAPLLQKSTPIIAYPSPEFTNLVTTQGLAKILERRWDEANADFQNGSYLSTIIMLGGILEGVLLDKTLDNPADANKAKSAPKDPSNDQVRPITEWPLVKLIEVAHECGWLRRTTGDFSQVLRSYRNFVHPREQLRSGQHYPEESDCRICWEVVRGALDELR